ncbi:MAG: hypothetical protein ACI4FY_06020 [Acetatifactor sp.]
MKYRIAYHREQEKNAPLILVQSFRRGKVPIAMVSLLNGARQREQGEELLARLEALPWNRKKWNSGEFFDIAVLSFEGLRERLTAEETQFALLFAVEKKVYLTQNTGNCFLVQRFLGKGTAAPLPERFLGEMEPGTCLLFADRTYPEGQEEKIGQIFRLPGAGKGTNLERRLAELSSGHGGGVVFILQEDEDEA